MTFGGHHLEPGQARQWIGEVEYLQRRTRIARQGFWLALIVLGIVILVSTPLYFQPSQQRVLGLPATVVFKPRPASMPLPPAEAGKAASEIDGRRYETPTCVATHGVVYTPCNGVFQRSSADYFPGGTSTWSPSAIALYWLIALPIAYLLIGWSYRRRRAKRGVATSPVAFVLAGLALLALLVITSPSITHLLRLPAQVAWLGFPGDLNIRGLTPLLTVGAGLFVLSYSERSRALALFAGAFFALALLVSLYDLENLAVRLGMDVGPEVGVFVLGAFTALGGLGFGLAHRRTSR
ncbi:MAG TPA: hypothetical protein VMU75_16125 [Acidimicrobiales bacterium]|nr:hypothetical protein [Acidimicrobiales bacterium]